MGVWKNNGVKTSHLRITVDESSVTSVQKGSAKDRKSSTYSIKRVYTTHATDKSLNKITFIYGKCKHTINKNVYICGFYRF